MRRSPNKDILRLIPPVDDVLGEVAGLRAKHPHFPWTPCLREILDRVREGSLGPIGSTRDEIKAGVVAALVGRVGELERGGVRRVINATGVVLHTNLGRAVLGKAARKAADEAMAHYVNLEIDLTSGKRSGRGEMLVDLIKMATGAESAMVVNNNAAAVYLVVDSYSPPGRVVVSRGELVEIGGSFRLPDILQKAATQMIEVGTTNRTYIDDYAREAKAGDILMRAHRSNYDIRGFTHDTSIAELVALARERRCHVVYDLGSGSFYDFAGIGIEGEEQVGDVLASGVDCVTMSGDKLLGGVQAGIIVGRKKFLDRFKQNPLRRAVRVDKITIAAMQALMRAYLFGEDPVQGVPTLQQATEPVDRLEERARALVESLPAPVREEYGVEVVNDDAAIGGGSFAVQAVESVALAFRCGSDGDATALARRLRTRGIPVLSRIKGSEVRLNLRSVLPDEDEDLKQELEDVFTHARGGEDERS
jgi:L-seryl-tRNA(Ser) seleniumtransferase